MPRLTVRPDDLTSAGARLSDDAETLAGAAGGVRSAGGEAEGALGPEGATVRAALDDYVAVEGVYAAALGDAVTLLGQALVGAGEAYAHADQVVAAQLGGGSGP